MLAASKGRATCYFTSHRLNAPPSTHPGCVKVLVSENPPLSPSSPPSFFPPPPLRGSLQGTFDSNRRLSRTGVAGFTPADGPDTIPPRCAIISLNFPSLEPRMTVPSLTSPASNFQVPNLPPPFFPVGLPYGTSPLLLLNIILIRSHGVRSAHPRPPRPPPSDLLPGIDPLDFCVQWFASPAYNIGYFPSPFSARGF